MERKVVVVVLRELLVAGGPEKMELKEIRCRKYLPCFLGFGRMLLEMVVGFSQTWNLTEISPWEQTAQEHIKYHVPCYKLHGELKFD